MKSELNPEIPLLAAKQAMLCKVFSNVQRIVILWILSEKEMTVTEIAQIIGASLQSTSQHLRLMELKGIVEWRREHHNIYYHVVENELLRSCLVLANKPKNISLENSPVLEHFSKGD